MRVEETKQIKPVVILKTGTMSRKDIGVLRKNGLCVVESDAPDDVRFMEPITSGYESAERAAIELFQSVMQTGDPTTYWQRHMLADKFVRILHGAKLKAVSKTPSPSQAG